MELFSPDVTSGIVGSLVPQSGTFGFFLPWALINPDTEHEWRVGIPAPPMDNGFSVLCFLLLLALPAQEPPWGSGSPFTGEFLTLNCEIPLDPPHSQDFMLFLVSIS